MKSSPGCGLCVERDHSRHLMQICKSSLFPLPSSLVSLTYRYKYLPGDGEIWNQRGPCLWFWVIWIKGIQFIENTQLFPALCFCLETWRIRLTVVLRWDNLSFSCSFWIPFPSARAYDGPNGSGKWLRLLQPTQLLKNTAVLSLLGSTLIPFLMG